MILTKGFLYPTENVLQPHLFQTCTRCTMVSGSKSLEPGICICCSNSQSHSSGGDSLASIQMPRIRQCISSTVHQSFLYFPAEAHEEYLHSLLRKTLLEDPEKVTPADKASSLAQPSLKQKFPPHVQLELRSLVQSTLELRPRIRSLTDVVSCFASIFESGAKTLIPLFEQP